MFQRIQHTDRTHESPGYPRRPPLQRFGVAGVLLALLIAPFASSVGTLSPVVEDALTDASATGCAAHLGLSVVGPICEHEAWTSRHANFGWDDAEAVAVSPDGGTVFSTGWVTSATEFDYMTIAYDADTGLEKWAARYSGPGGMRDRALAIDVSPDGSKVFVTGQSVNVGDTTEWYKLFDYATIAYDGETGEELWVARYAGPVADMPDSAHALAVSPDGSRVFVTGTSIASVKPWNGDPDNYDMATIAYDANTGEELWVARYDSPHGIDHADSGESVTVSPDGKILLVSGWSQYTSASFPRKDHTTIAYDTATGNELWVARENGPGDDDDEATAVAVSPDSTKVFVTGFMQKTFSPWSADYLTVAYDATTGNELWRATWSGSAYINSHDRARAIAVGPDGATVYVTGDSRHRHDGSRDPHNDIVTIAYDAATGQTEWLVRYGGTGGGRDDLGYAVAVTPDGTRVIVAGEREHPDTGHDAVTLTLDATSGDQIAEFVYSGLPGMGPGADAARDVAVSRDGTRAYVTGISTSNLGTGWDMITIAYRLPAGPAGHEVGIARSSPTTHACEQPTLALHGCVSAARQK